MNVYDSGQADALLSAAGHERAVGEEDADLILINTCSIRHTAEERVYGTLGRLYGAPGGKDRLLGVIGCMAQVHGAQLVEQVPYLALVAGTHAYPRLAEMVDLAVTGHCPQVEVTEPESGFDEAWTETRVNLQGAIKYPAYVSIMQGCNRRCTYCIVPRARGKEVCKPPDTVLSEIAELAQAGYREVTLIGQTVNSYQYDGVDLARLLELAAEVDGISWIRFMTSHPQYMTDRLIEVVAQHPRICEHFHLPVQSGSDRILKLMGRGHRWQNYAGIVEQMRKILGEREVQGAPSWGITTDLIVGFPGETEDDFQATLRAVEEIRWDGAYLFKYSVRDGTAAAKMPEPVPEKVKEDRLAQVIALQTQIGAEINAYAVGHQLPVLIEEMGTGQLRARTRTNKPVQVQCPTDSTVESLAVGDVVRVKVIEAKQFSLVSCFDDPDFSA